VTTMSVQVERSGGDDRFDDTNDVTVIPTSVGLSASNVRLAVVDLSGVAPVEDLYRVIIRGDGPSVVRNVSGIALDGDYLSSFPSGNGVEGGDFVAVFDVNGVQPTLQSIQENVFTPICSACHTGPTGPNLPAGMDLSSEAASLTSLVQAPSIQSPATMRVERGDANNSYLIEKLEGTASVGDRMPRGGPFLEQATVDAIRAWIDSGANP
jgi:hypothetical protein